MLFLNLYLRELEFEHKLYPKAQKRVAHSNANSKSIIISLNVYCYIGIQYIACIKFMKKQTRLAIGIFVYRRE